MSAEVPQNPQMVPNGNLTVSPVPQKKNNFSLILLSLLVLFLVGSGGFILAKYLYTPKTEVPVSSQPPVATPAPTQSPFSTPSASAPTDETANWKTYINNDYGFTFKYPSSWKLEKRSDPTFNNFAQINPKDVVEIAITDPSPNSYFLSFTVYRYLGLTPKQIVDNFSTSSTAKMMKSAGVFKRNSLVINGESAEAHRGYCQDGYCWLIYIRSVKRALMAEIFVQTGAEDINQTENSIISTFKFL